LGFDGPLVLNTKEDGLEERILTLLQASGITHYFFLDTAHPTLVRLLALVLGAHLSLRVSKWESVEAAQPWLTQTDAHARPGWIWLDCFGGTRLAQQVVHDLLHSHAAAQVCLVSPELQQAPVGKISAFAALGRLSAAICTKRPDLWRRCLHKAGH
jgi:hypothetical protein